MLANATFQQPHTTLTATRLFSTGYEWHYYCCRHMLQEPASIAYLRPYVSISFIYVARTRRSSWEKPT